MTQAIETEVSGRFLPWMASGQVLEPGTTSRQALERTGLDWQAQLVKLQTVDVQTYPGQGCKVCGQPIGEEHTESCQNWTGAAPLVVDGQTELRALSTTTFVPVPRHFAVVRSDNRSPLGVVGRAFVPAQNRDVFGFFDELVADGKVELTAAGQWDNGARVFITADMPGYREVGGVDPVKMHLLAINAHDGSMAVRAVMAPIRFACTNMLNLMVAMAERSWTFRHTKSVESRLREAKTTLVKATRYADRFFGQAERLINQEVVDAEFERMVREVFPPAKDSKDAQEIAAGSKKFTDLQLRIVEHFRSTPTIDDSFRHTAWGAVNAVGEYYDWARTIGASKDYGPAEARGRAALFGANIGARDKALDYLLHA